VALHPSNAALNLAIDDSWADIENPPSLQS
jgi:hypothetical protein